MEASILPSRLVLNRTKAAEEALRRVWSFFRARARKKIAIRARLGPALRSPGCGWPMLMSNRSEGVFEGARAAVNAINLDDSEAKRMFT